MTPTLNSKQEVEARVETLKVKKLAKFLIAHLEEKLQRESLQNNNSQTKGGGAA
jgi:hypothetical protein